MYERGLVLTLLFSIILAGCELAGSPCSEGDLIGTWELDYLDLCTQIMGPRMGPEFRKKTYGQVSTSIEFRSGGECLLHSGGGGFSSAKKGSWETTGIEGKVITVSVTLEEKTDKIKIMLRDSETIHMDGTPRFFPNPPGVDYIRFSRKPT